MDSSQRPREAPRLEQAKWMDGAGVSKHPEISLPLPSNRQPTAVDRVGVGPGQARGSPASSVLTVSPLLGSLRPILLKEYMRMLYTDAGCRSTMLAWLMVGEMLRVDCFKSQESAERTLVSNHSQAGAKAPPSLKHITPSLEGDAREGSGSQRWQ